MSKLSDSICLLGYSGHGFVVAEALLLLGYSNIHYANRGKSPINIFHLTYAGFEEDEGFPWLAFNSFALGIGDNHLRQRIAERVRSQSKALLTIIHPDALVSNYVKIGDGTFIARGACINPLVEIGTDVIINTAASIDHECMIASGAHIAPGATLAGNVNVGKGAFVGANAVIRQGIKIGQGAIIGAGAVVVNNVNDATMVIGNPAKPMILP